MRPKKGAEFKSIAVASPRVQGSPPRSKPAAGQTMQKPARSPSPTRHSSLNVENVLEKKLLSAAPDYASSTIDETFRRLQFYRYLASMRLDDLALQDTARVTMMLQEALQQAQGVLGADCIVVYMVQEMYLHVRAATSRDLVETNHSLVASLAGSLILQRAAAEDPLPVFVLNVQRDAAYQVATDIDGRLGTRTHSYVAYPIVFGGQVEAVLELRTWHEHYFCPVLLPTFVTAIYNLLHPRYSSTAVAKPALRTSLTQVTRLLEAKNARPPPPSANAALAQALKGVVQLTGADIAAIFHVSHTTQRVMETATSGESTDILLFPRDKGPSFAAIAAVLARYGPVEMHDELTVVRALVGDASVVSAAVVSIPGALDHYSVLCTSTTAPSLACEPNVYKLVRAIMTSGCEIDKLSHDVGLLTHQKAMLVDFVALTNEVWMTSDGGRKMQLICSAGAAFFATKDFRLYVCDRVHKELWSFDSSGISSGKHVAFGDGVVGAIVESKKSRWLSDVRVDDEGCATEYAPGHGTHACLVVPIYNDKGDVLAVSQALHKTSATMLKTDLSHVQRYDAGFLTVFASALARILAKNPALMMFAKVHADRERVTRLHHQAEAAKQHQRIFSLLQSSGLQGTSITSTEIATFNLVAKAAGKFARLRAERLKPGAAFVEMAPDPVRFLTARPELTNVDINVFDKSYPELKVLVVEMFQSYHLLIAFGIDSARFHAFLDAVEKGYRDLPYHNFYHAFSVTQFAYYLLSGDRMAAIAELDAFGLLIAALGHDLGHPGNDNAFEVATSSELAIRYNDISVLESHSVALLFGLLRDPACNLLEGLEPAKYTAVRHSIIQCILYTDIKYHAELVGVMTDMTDVKSLDARPDGKQLYLNWILHASDLGASGLSAPTNVLWMERVCTEFADQARRLREMGLPVPPHHASMDTQQGRSTLQVNFLDFVVLPLWTLTSQLFPHTKSLLDQIQRNREYFFALSQEDDDRK
ncbi:3'5'-cyclic nucleotide phosphodiesterase [Achlya hypogyna]|uniref:Phosphodiesterase n=1 Tax=Achlya hypogyna TaxID=1202772 RepID=A0A1V9Z259_ACHHY|nr:3'5'-cyclic nucleotide phosphodiesterase [Achlya hypogyna]